LDIGRAKSAKVLETGIGHKGVSLSVAADHCTSGLGKFEIVGHAENWWGGVADHVLPRSEIKGALDTHKAEVLATTIGKVPILNGEQDLWVAR
jgi:hypothetical protein